MSSLIAELERKEILTAQAVLDIRRYIAAKFPSMSSVERARVFADAVNRVVDKHIPDIQEVQKLRLKEELFVDAFRKPAFRLDKSQVFLAAVNLGAADDSYFKGMASWLGGSLGVEVDEESVANLIIRVRRLMDEVPEYSIADALGMVEEGLLEAAEKDIVQQLPEAVSSRLVQASDESDARLQRVFIEAAGSANGIGGGSETPQAVPGIRTMPDQDVAPALESEINSEPFSEEDLKIEHVIDPPQVQLHAREPIQPEYAAPEEMRTVQQLFTVLEEPIYRRKKPRLNANLGKVLVAAGFAGLVFSSLFQFDIPFPSKAAEVQLADSAAIHESLAKSRIEEITHNRYSNNRYDPSSESPAEGQRGWRGKRMFQATAYDLSLESCGKSREDPGYGITATGVRAVEGRTIAVDPSVIELGSRVYLTFPEKYSRMNGLYVAEDTGRLIQGMHIDIFFGEDQKGSREVYQRAMIFGVQQIEVELVD